MATKTCFQCGAEKDIEEFGQRAISLDGHDGTCKECKRVYRKKHYQGQEEKKRIWFLRRNYDITIEQYESMLVAQGGVCAICRQPETHRDWRSGKVMWLAVDHDHLTGVIRGLLCNRCNSAIGYLDEQPERLVNAMEYLRRFATIAASRVEQLQLIPD